MAKMKKLFLHGRQIIIGFTGSLGSGSSYVAKGIADKYNYEYAKLSQILRDRLKRRNKITIDALQTEGNKLRKEKGDSALVDLTFHKLDKSGADLTSRRGIIIDGIKNEGEIKALATAPNFFLFSIHAPEDIRARRLLEDNTFVDINEFKAADSRDIKEEFSYGQQVKTCDYHSDVTILNDDNIPDNNEERRNRFFEDIYSNYIRPIQDYADKRKTNLRTPSINELCMTFAYSVSKMSACAKRKVGAVIVEIKEAKDTSGDPKEVHQRAPIIVSSGYNDVPLGLHKCLYHPDFEMCYREFLRQQHAKSYKFCPNCGQEIRIETFCKSCGKSFNTYTLYCDQCKSEIEDNYICKKCEMKIFEVFSPGCTEIVFT